MPTLLFYHIILQHLIYQMFYNSILYIKIIFIIHQNNILSPPPLSSTTATAATTHTADQLLQPTTTGHPHRSTINHQYQPLQIKIKKKNSNKHYNQYQPLHKKKNTINQNLIPIPNLTPTTRSTYHYQPKSANHQQSKQPTTKGEREIGEIGAAMTMAMIGVASPMPLASPTMITMAMIQSEWR